MTDYKEILRILAQGLSQRNTALACGVSRNTVADVARRCQIYNLTWEMASQMANQDIKSKLFPIDRKQRDETYAMPDCKKIHEELAKSHVTLTLLWEEYCLECRQRHQRHYQYTQFRKYYEDYAIQEKVRLRTEHRPGELMEVDWAGTKPQYQDPGTGLFVRTPLFVSVLPYSQILYAEVFEDETLPNWIAAHNHAFQYLGGVPHAITPDNLKTGVSEADWFSPVIQKTYHEMATYYGTVILPARPFKPRDKPSVENSVKIASRRIIAALRNRQFLSFEELHQACLEELEKINSKIIKDKEKSRWDLFLSEEKDHLLLLGKQPYEYAEWSPAKVQVNSHISFKKHFYSVPYEYLQKEVQVRSTRQTVEIFYHQERIASHPRLWGQQLYSTVKAHMPPDKQFFQDWDADRFLRWAKEYGPDTVTVVAAILNSSPVVQQTYNSCMGIMSLAKKYTAKRLERACRLACLRTKSPTYRLVKDILAKEEDLQTSAGPVQSNSDYPGPKGHQRGADYFGGHRDAE
jgi:transposase